MKHIFRLGNNRYVHLDSYKSYIETGLGEIFVAFLTIAIATITVGAVLGVDITNPNTPHNHGTPHRIDR
jgi:hypothetical protein